MMSAAEQTGCLWPQLQPGLTGKQRVVLDAHTVLCCFRLHGNKYPTVNCLLMAPPTCWLASSVTSLRLNVCLSLSRSTTIARKGSCRVATVCAAHVSGTQSPVPRCYTTSMLT
jgi:hypothetical protein